MNWLFAGGEGGKAAATLMSLRAACMGVGVDPFSYLRDVRARVSTHPNSRIEELRPDRWKPAEVSEPPGRKGVSVPLKPFSSAARLSPPPWGRRVDIGVGYKQTGTKVGVS
jgi:hypothetical protein